MRAKTADLSLTRQQPDTGTHIKPGPAVVAGPGRVVEDGDLAHVGAEAGLNGPFVADLLAAMAAHESMSLNLYRAFAAQTNNPMLGARFKAFEGETLQALAVYRELIEALGGRWGYISPAARLTEAMDAKMVEAFLLCGSADPLTVELKMVEAVLHGATSCFANVSVLAHLAAGLPEGEVRTALEAAVGQLEGPVSEHLEWAAETHRTLAVTHARSAAAHKTAMAVETVVGKVKDLGTAIKDALA